MKCVVVNGTEQKGCTYNLKEIFLDELKPRQLTEFYLPKDAPNYCTGCKLCFVKSETLCPHYQKVEPIWQAMLEADLIIFAYPVYVLRAPGHVKSLLDHLGVHWFAHRPDPRMFNKTAVIITQSIGAPNKEAQKDVKTCLNWLGVSRVKKIGFGMMEGVIWNEISEARRAKFERKIRKFARQFHDLTPANRSLKTKFIFQMCKMMQTLLSKKTPEGQELSPDLQHWIDNGWVVRK
ncbi:MAG TPA: NAD(P)H-dependent oxidoreductase [Clostridiaceae bacterium]|nr:NAD(P)H-dependent oxidoreductase [Clostridiaceae bacterium]